MQHTVRIHHVARAGELIAEARRLLTEAGVSGLYNESFPTAPLPNLDSFLGASQTAVADMGRALTRQQAPIRHGDEVTVENRWGRHGNTAKGTVGKVGRTLVHVDVGGSSKAFRLDNGREHPRGIENLNADDIARIRRDLAPQR